MLRTDLLNFYRPEIVKRMRQNRDLRIFTHSDTNNKVEAALEEGFLRFKAKRLRRKSHLKKYYYEYDYYTPFPFSILEVNCDSSFNS